MVTFRRIVDYALLGALVVCAAALLPLLEGLTAPDLPTPPQAPMLVERTGPLDTPCAAMEYQAQRDISALKYEEVLATMMACGWDMNSEHASTGGHVVYGGHWRTATPRMFPVASENDTRRRRRFALPR